MKKKNTSINNTSTVYQLDFLHENMIHYLFTPYSGPIDFEKNVSSVRKLCSKHFINLHFIFISVAWQPQNTLTIYCICKD